MTTITREQALKIIEAADEVISALAGTNEDVHPGSDNMLRLWDDLNDRYAPPEVVRELARIALASLDAEPVAWTSEGDLAEVYCGETGVIGPKYIVGDVPLYRHAQPVSVDKEFIPKNLDKALGVVGVALPESKEEFNFQIERWIQRLIDRVIRYADEFKEQPAPVVPDEMATSDDMNLYQKSFAQGYNACRAAMLQGVEQPQNARQNIPENIPDGNSPAIPDDWVMVPKEPTQAMIKAWLSEIANFRGHAAGYKAALAAAPQQEMK
ncbi:TPA: DUF551 domain-containing protein [Salmonella enterica subsp. enterica serovar Bredeney]|uniref:DUF551 domain-containing protein n=2 Tax=Salmonella enterica I TaxID=59201 RepID=A0A5W3EX35_SALET|nr:DUF551 domain-containing protein [Salmonella enterica subsp. enterica serovar Bredeney]EBE6911210.1 DUF551 domain-containing protein [Salmonella enterica]EBQ9986673.1 dTDP-6-deoxy-D-glucose-3,5-epimerase [Salmonella enterica subsp. enterica serovar Schwarzengrund]EAA6306426.1 DUF551 domain-containing protein [Salmonella enterica subsp. enterica serovar Bredeney]EAC0531664.1 DUF551 domain-containing protein [Salmonella enterica subsp. enterica serovar Bredeney]